MGDCHSLLALALSPDHLDDLPSASDEIGEQPVALSATAVSGLVASAKRAMTAASIGSVLARCPSALAKDQCAGLTTTIEVQPPPRPPLRRSQSRRSPPTDNLRRDLPQSCGQTLQSSRIALDYKRFSTRTNSDIETILRHVDPDSDHVHGDPSLPIGLRTRRPGDCSGSMNTAAPAHPRPSNIPTVVARHPLSPPIPLAACS